MAHESPLVELGVVIDGIRYRPARAAEEDDRALAELEKQLQQKEAGFWHEFTGKVLFRHIQPIHACIIAEDVRKLTAGGRPLLVGCARAYLTAVYLRGKRRLTGYHDFAAVLPEYRRRHICERMTAALDQFFPLLAQELSYYSVDIEEAVAMANKTSIRARATQWSKQEHALCQVCWGGWYADGEALQKALLGDEYLDIMRRMQVQKLAPRDAIQALQKHFREMIPVDLYLIPQHPLCLGVLKASFALDDTTASSDEAILVAWDTGRVANWHTESRKPQRTVTFINLACTPSTCGEQLLRNLVLHVCRLLTSEQGSDAFAFMTHSELPVNAFLQSLCISSGMDQFFFSAGAHAAEDLNNDLQQPFGLDWFQDPRCMQL